MLTPNSRVLLVLAIAAVLAGGAAPAFAQAGSPRGTNGVFGGDNKADENATQKLDVTLSLSEAYDSDVPLGLRSTIGLGDMATTGESTMLVTDGAYSWQGYRVQARATGTASQRYYPGPRTVKGVGHSAGAGLSFRLGRATSLLLNQKAAFVPAPLYGLFPTFADATLGDAPPAAQDYGTGSPASYSYGSDVTLTHDVTPRSRLSATTDYQRTDFQVESANVSDTKVYSMAGSFARRVSRNIVASARYHYRTGLFSYGGELVTGSTTEHTADIGIDVSRPLSRSRRLAFDLRVGSTAVLLPGLAGGVLPGVPDDLLSGSPDGLLPGSPDGLLPESPDDRLQARQPLRLMGQASLTYQFGRTWQARAAYRESVDYVPGLTAPVSTEGYSVTVDGLLSRRLDVVVAAGYSTGESIVRRDAARFDTYTGSVRFRFALARSLATHVEYLYYFYDFRGNSRLAPGIPPGLERNGVRAGLTVLVPALRR